MRVSFIPLARDSLAAGHIDSALPWVHDAGNPYYDWFFGDPGTARKTLQAWMSRPSSEVFVGGAVVLTEGSRTLGGLIALPGAEVRRRRTADAVAAMRSPPGRGVPAQRIRASSGLFLPPRPDEFYLSKMGLTEEARGRGLGRLLVDRYIAEGLELGFRRFRLDVAGANRGARRLYDEAGFKIEASNTSPEAGMTYLSMTLES